MGRRRRHLDQILKSWPFVFGEVTARVVSGSDSRDVLQLRVDMGVLQMEATGKPDGSRPGGMDTYYDYLVSLAFEEGESFALDSDRCTQIDREFMQFFHRRVCWLALREFANAVRDADHSLALMDFSSAHAPSREWAWMHEQYRPFVLFHRTQAATLVALEASEPDQSVAELDAGLDTMAQIFQEHDAEDEFEEDELVEKLREMRKAICEQYELGQSLAEQLANAIAAEQYELAAELRDKIARRTRPEI